MPPFQAADPPQGKNMHAPLPRQGIRGLAASPIAFLMTIAFLNWLGYASWVALLNNFAKEAAGFTGREIGLLQSVREIPGFLAFTALALFMFMREQTLAYLSLVVLGVGVALTGFFPTTGGLLMTTFIMSVGFHYMETANQALQLQLLSKSEAPAALGRIGGANAVAQFLAYGSIALVWLTLRPSYVLLFAVSGAACVVLTGVAFLFFKKFDGPIPQRKGFVLRKRYWLYYALTFMSGARRQIFMAFAGFLLVERFGYGVTGVAMLFLVTCLINTLAAPQLGSLVGRIGERATIMMENISLIVVFIGYAFARDGWLVGALYIVDGVFFTLVIAQRTYLQKIADPADIAPTSAVAFTINHIAAVAIPVTFGLIWLWSPSAVFLIGAGIATGSLGLSFLVPRHPEPGRETVLEGARPGTGSRQSAFGSRQ
jgi:hypothetical protein